MDVILERLFSDGISGSKLNSGYSDSFGVDPSAGISTQAQQEQPTTEEPFTQPSPLNNMQPSPFASPKEKFVEEQLTSLKEPLNIKKSSETTS